MVLGCLTIPASALGFVPVVLVLGATLKISKCSQNSLDSRSFLPDGFHPPTSGNRDVCIWGGGLSAERVNRRIRKRSPSV